MSRNRIVIPLDADRSPRSRGSRRGGWGRPLLLMASIALLLISGIAAGGYFWWRNYQSGPGYSLALLADAAQRNDTATVDTFLDYEKISADLYARARGSAPGSSFIDSLPLPQLNSATSALTERARQTVREQARKEAQRLTEAAGGKPFVFVALAVPWLFDVDQNNDTAMATANIKGEQIQLTMQRTGDRWRIVAIKDDNLTKLVTESLIPGLRR